MKSPKPMNSDGVDKNVNNNTLFLNYLFNKLTADDNGDVDVDKFFKWINFNLYDTDAIFEDIENGNGDNNDDNDDDDDKKENNNNDESNIYCYFGENLFNKTNLIISKFYS